MPEPIQIPIIRAKPENREMPGDIRACGWDSGLCDIIDRLSGIAWRSNENDEIALGSGALLNSLGELRSGIQFNFQKILLQTTAEGANSSLVFFLG